MHGIGRPIAFQLAVVERLGRVMGVRRSHRSIFSLTKLIGLAARVRHRPTRSSSISRMPWPSRTSKRLVLLLSNILSSPQEVGCRVRFESMLRAERQECVS